MHRAGSGGRQTDGELHARAPSHGQPDASPDPIHSIYNRTHHWPLCCRIYPTDTECLVGLLKDFYIFNHSAIGQHRMNPAHRRFKINTAVVFCAVT